MPHAAVNAMPGFRYLAWLTAASVAVFFAAGAFRFGTMVEPEQTNFPALLVFLSLGLASQIGLIAAPWALSQSLAVRVVVAALMAPARHTSRDVSRWGRSAVRCRQSDVAHGIGALSARRARVWPRVHAARVAVVPPWT